MANLTSTQSGNWSSASTWGGTVPSTSSNIIIAAGHTITIDVNSQVDGAVVYGTLKFSPTTSILLQSTKNIVLQDTGVLEMKPVLVSIIHNIRFIGINENNYVGGGMDVLATDIGLWVMGGVMGEDTGGGRLDLEGTYRTAWVNSNAAINTAATSIPLKTAPTGWQNGDILAITPTEPSSVGDAYITGTEEKIIASTSGTTLSITTGMSRSHPKVNNKWTAEVANVTRNVIIEGTSGGRAHIFIRSNATQSVKNTLIRWMGPRKVAASGTAPSLVLGRYGLHFHHCMNGSRGSVIHSTVIKDTGNHAFVSHVSDGITYTDCVSYNTIETPFWWDEKEFSHDIIYDHCGVIKTSFVPGSLSVDTDSPSDPRSGVSGFFIGMGIGNVAKNGCFVTGFDMGEDFGNGGGYNWEADNEGVWEFTDCVAHNMYIGLRVWQNTSNNHVIDRFICYNAHISHGAYANSYTYLDNEVYSGIMAIEASSATTTKVRLITCKFDAAGISPYCVMVMSSPIPAPYPTYIRGCTFAGFTQQAVLDNAENELKNIDLIQCSVIGGGTLAGLSATATTSEVIRVQPLSGQATRITKSGTTNIANFAPTFWGNGKGLKGEYFSSTNFTNKVVERIDSILAFDEWGTIPPHQNLTSNVYSVRWTGQLECQLTGTYTFVANTGGVTRLWVNNAQLLNVASEPFTAEFTSSTIAMTQGQKYPITVEYINTDSKTALGLFWQTTGLAKEYIPQSQLYAQLASVNQPPIARAGVDQNITLPTNTTTLSGSTSTDDNTISSYAWARVVGPNTPTITGANTMTASLSGLIAGTYTYRLTVTDNEGLTSTDDVNIFVSAANVLPVARAGNDVTITLPTNSVSLNGSTSSDADGTIASYNWSRISGPNTPTIATPTQAITNVTGLIQGTYVFRLTVIDNSSGSNSDDITVVVNAAASNIPPVVTVGTDVLIILPTDVATITGGATDSDGTIASHTWTKVSGPSTFTITNASNYTTTVTGLVAGVYVFRLTATDNSGASSSKDMSVIVSPVGGVTIQGRYNIIIQ